MGSETEGPLKRNWFLILLALSERPRHGADIVRDVLDQTDGEVRLWPATLYGSLERLAEEGLIEELTDPDEHPEGVSERRRYYRITEAGAAVLAEESKRLAGLTRTAEARLARQGWRAV